MNKVDLQHLPFSAYSLIEASAGTGKTYTISQLVLRLVLLGQTSTKPLAVSEILVVTFTKAATQELKDRIRENLVTALEQIKTWKLEGLIETNRHLNAAELPAKLKESQANPLLAIIIDGLSLHGTEYSQSLLQHAIFSMDEAPIFTIHSFCQRMLGEYALLAKQPLQLTLLEQIKPTLITLAQQFWREQVYGFDKAQTAVLLAQFKTPRELADKLSSFLSEELLDESRFHNFVEYQQACDQLESQFIQARQLWLDNEDEIKVLFDGKVGASYRSNNLPARFKELNDYLNEGHGLTGLSGGIKKNKITYFFQSIINEKCSIPLAHPLFEILDQMHLGQAEIKLGFISLCRRSVVQSLSRYKTENNVCFFDDLITGLVQALTSESSSSEILAETIRARFPVALIDEFQDTDNQQFTIFDAIYRRNKDTALMMIGDPKQAIYSFRGADIQTYFKARECVDENQQYTLDVNWRSLPALVSAVNTLFKHNESAFVQEGFPEYPWVNSPAAFNEWQGLCLSDAQNEQQGDFAVSVFNQSEVELNKADGSEFVAKQTAEFLAELLKKGSRINGDIIQPKDIAILVRKGTQAKVVQKALLAQGLNSIFLSKETVFECDEVPAFIRLIKACVNPFDTALTLAALGDELIAYQYADIQQLNNDPNTLFEIQDAFSEAKALAQRKGFIVMWQWLLNHFNIATSLLIQRHGERRLTNINQLAEIAHSLSPAYDLEQQLQSFIDIYLQSTEGDGEEGVAQKLRLDTEANLIEIVTIHGSKGLEYPMVCCPFVSETDDVRKGFNKLYNSEQSAYDIVWQANDEQTQQLAKDQLAEDIRLLYVAFTRAKYHLNISWQPFKGVDKTPLWHLIGHALPALKDVDHGSFIEFFQQLESCVINPSVTDVNVQNNTLAQSINWQTQTLTRQFYQPNVARSYSALLVSQHHSAKNIQGEDEWHADSEYALANDEGLDLISEVIDEHALTMFNFPRGAHPGNFLHLLYETIDFHCDDSPAKVIDGLSEQYLIETKWQPCLLEHTALFMHKTLHPIQLSLSQLQPAQVKKEMGFHLMAKSTQGSEVAKILSQYRGGEGIESLNNMQGLFKGFIDLVFENNGQYYVLDYKSNHLGHSFSDYNDEKMHQGMLDHNYDLQYLVYCTALHLFLQQRLTDYNYDEHIGGIFYIFLRGINDIDNAGIYFRKPPFSIINRLARHFDSGEISELIAQEQRELRELR